MRNALVYHLVSGQAWFSCIALFLIILAFDIAGAFHTRRRAKLIVRVFLLSLTGLAAVSGTPLSLLLAAPLLAAVLAYIFAGFANPSRRRIVLACLAGSLALMGLALEIPYHVATYPKDNRPKKLYIFGDSITAGGFGEKQRYPSRVAELAGIEVKDLAHAGATADSALMFQAPRLQPDAGSSWALIEIGGNDMLHGTPSAVYAENLEKLILAARGEGAVQRKLLMYELPIVPACWAFGRFQRQLAAKYDVTLIPKRVLAGILLEESNTVDGIHLTQRGHDQMAEELLRYLGTASSQPPRLTE